jgi:glutamate synthase domain-containing protein 3
VAVVEGAGEHCCEYMTGGSVVVLGATGGNFGAGMTGGTAYVFDRDGSFPDRVNPAHVSWLPCSAEDLGELRALIAKHLRLTRSAHARKVLADWEAAKAAFWKVVPTASGAGVGAAAATFSHQARFS